MQAVAYIRVSSDEQVNNTSLDSQRKACLDYAKHNGIKLTGDDIYREEGVSAKLRDRPALAAMLDCCAKNKGKITHCIVYKVDRLARDSAVHHVIKATLAKSGTKLVSVTEPIDDTPTGSLMDSMLAAFAQFDNEIRMARTQGGMRARSLEGAWPHDAPIGYIKTRAASGASTIKPDPVTAETVTKLLHAFATGSYTVKQLMELAYEQGLTAKNGKMRRWQTIKNMLENPIYAGYIKSTYTDGKMIKAIHEPLIDDRTFFRNLSILSGQVKNFSRQAETDWPLRGGFIKHTCGKAMTGSAPKGNSGPSPRYSCIYCRASVLGKKVSTPRLKVHDDFTAMLADIKPSEGIVKLYREVLLRKWNAEFKDAIEHSGRIDKEMQALQVKKSKVLDLYIDGKLSEQDYQSKVDEVEQVANTMELQRVEADQYVKDREGIIDAAMLFMFDPAAFWNIGGLQVKRRVQDLIFPEGLVYDCVDGFRTPVLSQSYLLMKNIALASDKNPNVVAATGIEPVTSGL